MILLVASFHPAGSACADDDELAWPFAPLERPPLPSCAPDPWVREAVDAYVLEALEKRDLRPSDEADRRTLIRRLSFDLRGLPPTPEEVERFVADSRPGAWERLVDRYLASPAYGEKWARHWLDVVRFTESQGFEYDRLRDHAWQYRDRVIAAFNRDEPFDEFVRAQIAGDVTPNATRDDKVATSLLVCGPWDQAGNSQANETQRRVTREEEMEGLVSVVSQSFLGITVNCARCHDHKYDPVTQKDYYRMRAVFDGVFHGEASILPEKETQARMARIASWRDGIQHLRGDVSAIENAARDRVLVLRGAERSGRKRPKPEEIEGLSSLPTPYARWTFENGSTQDEIGNLDGALEGNATISGGRLRLDGDGDFLRTVPLERDIREKTLEVRLRLPALEQRGGGAISIETLDGRVFDGVVFAEREPRKWIAGSDGFGRTRDLSAPDEIAGPEDLVHVAVTYARDGTIRVYRNGEPYGESYSPSAEPVLFPAGGAHVLLGLRHTGGGRPFLAAEIEDAALYDCALTREEVRASFESGGGEVVGREEILSRLEPTERARLDDLRESIERLEEKIASTPLDELSYIGLRREPAPARRLVRGDVRNPAEGVAPGGLRAIEVPSGDLGLVPNALEAERRRRFAAWLTDPRQPLTPRVIANRIWQWHFGRGIVETPNDFGGAGSGATHRELLDWLASELVESGWKLSRLHRRILLSSTYRQSSEFRADAHAVDSDAAFLWRYPPRRLEGEEVRDAMLFASGRLNRAMGGASFRPFTVSTFGSTFYVPFDGIGPEYERRTVYRMNVNSGKSPFLEALDCPDPSVQAPRRRATTTPLQALALMNSSFVLRQAASLAERACREAGGGIEAAVSMAWNIVLGRAPDAKETEAAISHAREHGLESLCWVLFNSSEFLHVR